MGNKKKHLLYSYSATKAFSRILCSNFPVQLSEASDWHVLGSAGHGAPVDWQLKAAQTVGDPKCSAWTETKLFSVGALEIQWYRMKSVRMQEKLNEIE